MAQEVLQSTFERAVIQVVTYIVENWKIFKKFRHKYELLEQLQLDNRNWGRYKDKTRNIPEKYHAHIYDVLVNEYSVSPFFLKNGRGKMFTNELALEEDEAPYIISPEKSKELRERVSQLEAENKTLHNTIATQDKLIKELEAKLKRR